MRGPRPYGWDWPLRPSKHAQKRMRERRFNALDVLMMQRPRRIQASETGCWIVEARLRNRWWRVIVVPDLVARVMLVVTAYPLRRKP